MNYLIMYKQTFPSSQYIIVCCETKRRACHSYVSEILITIYSYSCKKTIILATSSFRYLTLGVNTWMKEYTIDEWSIWTFSG